MQLHITYIKSLDEVYDDLGPTRKIHEKMDLQGSNDIHGLHMPFSWAKEDVKI